MDPLAVPGTGARWQGSAPISGRRSGRLASGYGDSIDLTLYRCVQEGLTNALKHAEASHADVIVRYGSDELQIEIRDDGRGATTTDGLDGEFAGGVKIAE